MLTLKEVHIMAGKGGRIFFLDELRALALIGMIVYHAAYPIITPSHPVSRIIASALSPDTTSPLPITGIVTASFT